MVKIDKKDKRILEFLDFNSRASLSEIAKKLGYSKQLVKYRLDELQKKGIIKGTYGLLDIFKVGYGCYRIFLKFQNLSEKKEKEIVDYILRLKKVKRVIRIGGEWDLVFVVWTKNLAELENTIEKLTLRFGKWIFNKYISIVAQFSYFRYKYAYDTEDFPSFTISLNQETVQLDKIDEHLIEILNKDGRIPIIKIAKKLRLSPVTIKKRIDSLLEKGVIKCFRLIINEDKLDYFNYWVYVKFKGLNPERIEGLVNFLKSHKNVLSVSKSVEKTDLEVNLFVKTPKILYEFISQLKFKFSDIIGDFVWYAIYS
ncbi:MAG: AsnC family transcriptional regulator [Nanoarchaeota archaeon]|nr:AsnC family transcriptional regulator [Nanoarchaeota archaeon]